MDAGIRFSREIQESSRTNRTKSLGFPIIFMLTIEIYNKIEKEKVARVLNNIRIALHNKTRITKRIYNKPKITNLLT
jgi:hypothetical protein